MNYVPYGRQEISEADIQAVCAVLRSDFLTQGPAGEAFEATFSSHCEAEHAVAVNSATSALHLACMALGVGPGDIVWTSPNSFVASANCARYCGAAVDFVDIDERTYNMSPRCLEKKLQEARARGQLPKVVIPVHFAGQSCEMREVRDLGTRYGFRIIEDASHAVGATYEGRKVGSCAYSDIAVFSFHPVKIITSGEGGAATTNDPALADRMRRLRSHGVTRDPSLMSRPSDGPWYYEQLELGFNYRMTDIQAALGRSQLARVDEWIDLRHAIARRYDENLAGSELTTPTYSISGRSALHLYVVLFDDPSGRKRRNAFEMLRAQGIGVNVHYIPIHLQPDFARFGFRSGDFPVAEAYYHRSLSLPMFPGLRDEDQSRVIELLLREVK